MAISTTTKNPNTIKQLLEEKKNAAGKYVLDDLIDGLLENPRHRTHFCSNLHTRAGKHGVNDAAHRKLGLSHQSAQRFVAAQPSRTVRGKTHERLALLGDFA